MTVCWPLAALALTGKVELALPMALQTLSWILPLLNVLAKLPVSSWFYSNFLIILLKARYVICSEIVISFGTIPGSVAGKVVQHLRLVKRS